MHVCSPSDDPTCFLNLLNGVVPLAWITLLTVWYTVRWSRWRTSVRSGSGDGPWAGKDDESAFDTAAAPLLGGHHRNDVAQHSSLNGGGGLNGHDTEPGFAWGGDSYMPLSVHAEAPCGTFKKDTVIHWTKFILYGTQIMYHAGVAVYDLLDGARDAPDKYASQAMLAAAWTLLCCVETLNHELPWTRRTSPLQLCFPLLCLGLGAAATLQTAGGVGGLSYVQLAPWDLGWILLVSAVELYTVLFDVPVKCYDNLTPEFAAGFWSFWHISWYTPMINLGYRKQLRTDDLPALIDGDRAANIWERFSRLLYPRGQESTEDGAEDVKVGRSVVRLGGYRYSLQALAAVIGAVTQLLPPLALQQVTKYMTDRDADSGGGSSGDDGVPLIVILCVLGLFWGQALANYADGQMFKLGRRMGIRARSALISAVFRKALALDMSSADAGQLQNYISVDAESVLNLMVFQMFMWSALLRLVACVFLLFWVLGVSAIGGLGLIFLTLPANKVLVGKLKKLQMELMKRRDVRMGVVNECMLGIRIIKFFAWEDRFLAKVFDARALEMVLLRSFMFTLGTTMVVLKSSPTLIGLVTFLLHTKAFGKELTAAAGFTALTLFQQLRMPLTALPDTLNYYLQARVSLRRIQQFLRRTSDDVRKQSGGAGAGSGSSDRHCAELAPGELKMEHATFRWRTSSEQSPTLADLTMHIKSGQLVCVYGPTGAGKSSLLLAFLQELLCVQGKVKWNGSCAYASQRAWIQNATLRDNILFGAPFNSARYEAVLESCALKPDLELLEAGDATEIGEKGVNLSGGQQQRVALARAAYAATDIVLMDDVLSAVDAHVGKHIFDKCIRGMLKGRTRVLVTHQVTTTARYADHIIIFNADGTLREQGSYQELTAGGESHLAEAIELAAGPGMLLRRASSSSFTVSGDEAEKSDAAVASTAAAGGGGLVAAVAGKEVGGGGGATDGGGTAADGGKGAKLVQEEQRAVGRPRLAVFLSYFRSCGGWWFGAAWAILSALWQGLTIAQSFFLRAWINEMAEGIDSGPGLWWFIGVSAASFGALLVRTLLITSGSLMASRTVHDNMARRVFGAPVSWFDATPLGRIFNRFSSDVVTLDKDLMNDLSSYSDMLLSVLGVVAVIAAALPVLTVAMVPILGLCYYYAERYLQTSRQLKRLEAVNRSPLFAHFSESVGGVSTIRAFEAEPRFVRISEGHVDQLNRTHLYLWMANYWLTNRVRNIGSAVCGLVGAFLVFRAGIVDGATAGLVLTYALQFTVAVVFTVRMHAQMEMSVNSIERLDEYTALPQEAPAVVPGNRPPAGWPSGGEVTTENLTLQYASSDTPVLRGVSFHVPCRTRIGIVGRTGAGKSSLMNALFRIVEPMPGSVIEIDGINVLRIGLRDLRRKLAIIPQEPTLFQGTLRSNIDCFDEHPDSAIWTVLRQCHLFAFVSSTEKKLEHEVAPGGSNLSVGQRQLLCMARALLRRAPVLVMDEATANVDVETDKAIQDTMREGFGDCTILCIAHRLATVVYYDRILVLDKGCVAEYDTPLNLLRNRDSAFARMCDRTGDFANLLRMAELAVTSSGRAAAAASAAATGNRNGNGASGNGGGGGGTNGGGGGTGNGAINGVAAPAATAGAMGNGASASGISPSSD